MFTQDPARRGISAYTCITVIIHILQYQTYLLWDIIAHAMAHTGLTFLVLHLLSHTPLARGRSVSLLQ